MAASLRAAATRILRPAVFPGQWIRRLTHTQQQHSVPHRASQIKQKKEELFDLIAKAEANSATTWFDRRLLKDLATQVKPRPNDPQWCKIIKSKAVTATLAVGAVVTYGLALRGLADRPKIVEYEGHLVTAESLPMLQGYQPAATAEDVHKQDWYQPAPTAEGVYRQDGYQPAPTD